MKCLFVLDHIFLRKSGKAYSNTFSYKVLKRYIDVFSEITVVARYRDVEDTGSLPASDGAGVDFIFLDSISSIDSFLGLRQRQQKRMEQLLADHDSVIVRLPSEYGLMAAKCARSMGKAYMVEVVGCAWDAMVYYGGWQSKLYAPFLLRRMKRAVKTAHYVGYVTEHFLQERYPAAKGAKTLSLSDIVLPAANSSVLTARVKKIERAGSKIVLGTIANIDMKYKGIDIAIKALGQLKLEGIEIEYRILGKGDPLQYKSLIESLDLGDSIYFNGELYSESAIFDWLDNIDIYLQPSLTEGLPRSLVEAMSRGCPAIGSSAGGIPELLESDRVFPKGDSLRLAQKISALCLDRRAMSVAAVNHFQRAKRYRKEIIEPERQRFLAEYRDEVIPNQI